MFLEDAFSHFEAKIYSKHKFLHLFSWLDWNSKNSELETNLLTTWVILQSIQMRNLWLRRAPWFTIVVWLQVWVLKSGGWSGFGLPALLFPSCVTLRKLHRFFTSLICEVRLEITLAHRTIEIIHGKWLAPFLAYSQRSLKSKLLLVSIGTDLPQRHKSQPGLLS